MSRVDGSLPVRPPRDGRRVWFMVVLALCTGPICVSVASASAASGAPEVGYLSASDVSTSGATIEVPINPEGSETGWEIWLECEEPLKGGQNCEPVTVGSQRKSGTLPARVGQEIVTDAVSGLQPGYLYKYRVVAANADGKAGNVGDGFLTCPAEGPCPSQPFLEGESLWNLEAAEREALEAPRLEAEREAAAREAAERPAKEAAALAAKEREAREAGEKAGREAAERAALTRSAKCVVPRLIGDSLAQARRALARAHCRLGRLSEPHIHQSRLVVIRQAAHSGLRLDPGASVAITLRAVRHG